MFNEMLQAKSVVLSGASIQYSVLYE